MSVEERLSPGDSQPVHDFSNLQGFQFAGARGGPSEEAAPPDQAERQSALVLELGARAARFHQAVDAAIILASDGTIRWLGDSIAKLAPGDDLMAPRAILLADEAMSDEARSLVLARLDLWLSATIQRSLGPLFALRGLQEGSAPLRELAAKIANALGVLERQPVRSAVRGLDQNERAVLRKYGVRFGSYYIYVPSTLRPAARALALQLWCLQKGDEDFTAVAQSLIPMASSGRTSAPPDQRVSGETYRIGGFRACSDRVVRVDIVERLADMIRAASTLRIVNGSPSGPTVFQVSSQMTSLTGCSGDGFAAILKDLGFESLTVQRSEIVWPAAAAPVAPAAETGVSASPDAEAEAGDAAEPSDAETAAAAADMSSPPDLESNTDAAPADLEASDADASGLSSEVEAPASEPPTEIPAVVEAGAASEPEAVPAPVAEESLVVWRFAHSPPPSRPRPARPPRRKPGPPEGRPQRQGAPENRDARATGPSGGRGPTEKHAATAEKPAFGAGRNPHKPSRPPRGVDDKREGRTAPQGRTGGEKRAQVDPMSPFAKLMELRSLLESESKKRS